MAVDMEKKKKNARFMIIYMCFICFIILAYLAAYLGALLDDGLDIIASFFQMVSRLQDFKLLFIPSKTSLVGILIVLFLTCFVGLMMVLDSDLHMAYNREEIAGSAGFMTDKDKKIYNQKFVEKVPASNKKGAFYSPNMILSKTMQRTINDRKSGINNNTLIIGIAGTGKSRFLMKPNIMQMNASYVITDPSGELVTSMGTLLKNNGYKIKIFNVSDMAHSNKYNPLKYIQTTADIATVIDCFIKNTTDKNTKADDFFPNAEKLVYSACIAYLLKHCDDEDKKNFASVLKMINASNIDESNPKAKSPLDQLFDSLPKNSIAKTFYRAYKQGAGKTLKSIIISCLVRLRPFMTPEVANLTQYDELELDKIGDEKTALFIITSQNDKSYDFLVSMLYTQLFSALYSKAEKQKVETGSERLKYHVRCMMDEFANVGQVPNFPDKVTTMRKYNISVMISIQDKQQLESLYKDEYKTIIANCSSLIFLGSNENDTKKYIEEMIGYMTAMEKSYNLQKGKSKGSSLGFKSTKRPVRFADEVGRMEQDECMIFTVGQRPVIDKKYVLTDHPMYNYISDSEETKDLLFQYNKMPIFDTTKPFNLKNLLRAEKEANRILKERDVTDPKLAKDISVKGSIEEILNGFVVDQNEDHRFQAELLNECINESMKFLHEKVSIVLLKSMPSDILRMIAMQTAITLEHPVIIFSDNDPKNLTGYFYNTNDSSILLAEVLNEYVLQHEKLQDCYKVILRKNVYLSFKNKILNQ